jgi:hypothetical protein
MDTRCSNDIIERRELFDRMMKRINTAIPGQIASFDPATQTCSVTPAIKVRLYLDGKSSDAQLPTYSHVPLIFPFAIGAGFAVTLPVSVGDSCLLIFSQRCIDNWYQHGGIQPVEAGTIGARHHDMNDGFALICGGALPNVLGSWCTDGIELRNRARTVRVTVRDSGLEFDGPASFLKPVTFHDTIDAKSTSTFEAAATFQAAITDKNGIDHTLHKHADPQGGVVGVPTT